MRLSEWRKMKGLTQAAAADLFGFSRSALAAVETGVTVPNLKNAVTIQVMTRGKVRVLDWYPELAPILPSRERAAAQQRKTAR